MRSVVKSEKDTAADDGIEYRLYLANEPKETGEKCRTVVVLETTRLFAAFRYELAIEETVSQNEVHYRVTGLKTPKLSLPASGPASFRREYDGLYGTYRFTFEGLDRKVTSFVVEIKEERVTMKRPPADDFLEVLTR